MLMPVEEVFHNQYYSKICKGRICTLKLLISVKFKVRWYGSKHSASAAFLINLADGSAPTYLRICKSECYSSMRRISREI